MAKRKQNKSEAIRALLAEKPGAKPKEIAAELKIRKIRVSTALISRVKYGAKPKRRGKKAQANGHVSMDNLLAAKALVAKLGSVDAARNAIDSLAKLID